MRAALAWVHKWLAVITLVLLVVEAAWYQHEREAQTRQARADVCTLVEANDNGLITAVTPAPTPEKRAESQAKLDQWARYVNDNSGIFHCHLHFLPAP